MPGSAADWLPLAGGLCFAATNVMLHKLADSPSQGRMLAMFGGGAIMAAAAGLAGVAGQEVPAPAFELAGWPVALGLCLAFLVGNLALQYGAARLAASTTALVMLTELLFASVSSAWLGAADFSQRTFLGGSLIVLAALLAARTPGTESGPPADPQAK